MTAPAKHWRGNIGELLYFTVDLATLLIGIGHHDEFGILQDTCQFLVSDRSIDGLRDTALNQRNAPASLFEPV